MGVRVVETTTQTQFFAAKNLFRFLFCFAIVLYCILLSFCILHLFSDGVLYSFYSATRFFILFIQRRGARTWTTKR
jgi:hypothetical protein